MERIKYAAVVPLKRIKHAVVVLLCGVLTSYAQTIDVPVHKVPKQEKQVAGYYRMQLGDYEVTALNDGDVSVGLSVFESHSKLPKKQIEQLPSDQFAPKTAEGGLRNSVNGYLINTGDHLVLIDAGADAQYASPAAHLGDLVGNLKASGYDPSLVDVLLFTHLHYDHFSGITQGGGRVYPNATIYLAEEEKAYWIDTPMEQIPEGKRRYAVIAREVLKPYLEAQRVKTFRVGTQLLKGIRSVATQGHTPGHSSYEVSSKGETLLMWGDIVHSLSLQFAHPEIVANFDSDIPKAEGVRQRLFADIAKRRIWVGAAHLPFPGIGHIHKEAKGYQWIPIAY